MADDNFSDTPLSVSEVKAGRMHDGSIWTPRDALINLLRDIDSGKIEVEAVIIGFKFKDEEGTHSGGYNISSPNGDATIALWERTKYRFMERLMG